MEVGDAELVHPEAGHDPETPQEVVRDAELSERVNEDHPAEDEQKSGVGHARVGDVEHTKGRAKRMKDLWRATIVCSVLFWDRALKPEQNYLPTLGLV